MKVLYNNFQDLTWINFFQRLQKLYNIRPAAIIDKFFFLENTKKTFSDVILINMDDCLTYSNKLEDQLNIINHKIFKAHRYIAQDLLSRFSTNHENSFSQREKDEIYYQSIIFWYYFLKNNKFDLFLSKLAPHNFYDYIIYLCCKILKIKTLFFSGTIVKDRFLLKSRINNRALLGYENFKANYNPFEYKSTEEENNFYNSINQTYQANMPWYVKKYRFLKNNYNKYFVKYILKLILNLFRLSFIKQSDFIMKTPEKNFNLIKKNFSKFDHDKYVINSIFKKKKLFKLYKKISSSPDITKKFIYFAAAYQPELSSSPAGGNFQDHFKTLSLIEKNLPDDYFIYYKEHPTIFNPELYMMGDIKRSNLYYQKLSSLKKLKFVSLDFDSLKLIRNALTVITISGEIGFEAILEKKPSIVFSKTWYSAHNSVFYVNSDLAFSKAIKNILNKNYNFLDVPIFLNFFFKNAIKIPSINHRIDLNEIDKKNMELKIINNLNEKILKTN